MAVVDVATGKIVGCKENTLVWFHEKGHIEFNKKDIAIEMDYYKNSTYLFSLLLLILSNIFRDKGYSFILAYGALSFFMFGVTVYLYEELWCWAWGFFEYQKFIASLPKLSDLKPLVDEDKKEEIKEETNKE